MDYIAAGESLISNFHYFGLALVTLVIGFCFSIPIPISLFIVFASAFLNPWLVAIIGAVSLTLGDFFAFYMGVGAVHFITHNKKSKRLEKIKKRLKARKSLLPVFAFLPLPPMILGVAASFVEYKIPTFLSSVFLGRILRMGVYAFVGYYGLGYVLGLL